MHEPYRNQAAGSGKRLDKNCSGAAACSSYGDLEPTGERPLLGDVDLAPAGLKDLLSRQEGIVLPGQCS